MFVHDLDTYFLFVSKNIFKTSVVIRCRDRRQNEYKMIREN